MLLLIHLLDREQQRQLPNVSNVNILVSIDFLNTPDLPRNGQIVQQQQIEDVEKSCMRLVARAMRDYKDKAIEIFKEESDFPGDIAEDVTREALDALGTSSVPIWKG